MVEGLLFNEKKNKYKTSISYLFAKKYIYYYYAFFWLILTTYLILNEKKFKSKTSKFNSLDKTKMENKIWKKIFINRERYLPEKQ